MWDFKFDAPKYFNFFRKEKHNESYEINMENNNDVWFLQEHLELTPMKNQQQFQDNRKAQKSEKNKNNNMKIKDLQAKKYVSKGMDQITNKNLNKIKQQKVEKLKRFDINQKLHSAKSLNKKNQFSFKISQVQCQKQKSVDNIIFGTKRFVSENCQNKFVEQNRKVSKVKSEVLTNPIKNKIRIPCPYPRKIQKDWQTKSNKSWYDLSRDQAEKALKSMKKINEVKKELNYKK